jgi:transcriptional regulator with XRE-family HTH domain
MFHEEINEKFITSKSFFKKVNNNLSIFDQINVVRSFLGMKQKQLSKRTNISQPNISAIEAGKKNVNLNTLKKIADALECDLQVILTPKKKSLSQTLDDRVTRIAKVLAEAVFRNISFEGHFLTEKKKKTNIDSIKRKLINNKSMLWEEKND